MKPENPSAFPLNPTNDGTPGAFCPEPGMTLRDYFAGKMATGFAQSLSRAPESAEEWKQAKVESAALARLSYVMADAMLAARQSNDMEGETSRGS